MAKPAVVKGLGQPHQVISRTEAGLVPARKHRPLDIAHVRAASLHDEGTCNVKKRFVTKRFGPVLSVQRWHMEGVVKAKDGRIIKSKWSDAAYSFMITMLGELVAVHGLDTLAFAEGKYQRNSRYADDWPDWMQSGKATYADFISIICVGVGVSVNNVKPYQVVTVYGEVETIQATKGQYVPPTRAQLRTLDWAMPMIRDELGRHIHLHGHGGHRIKDCPGPDLWRELRAGRWTPERAAATVDSAAAPPAASTSRPPKRKVSGWDRRRAEAVGRMNKLGITDGTRLEEPMNRGQGIVMADRLYTAIDERLDGLEAKIDQLINPPDDTPERRP